MDIRADVRRFLWACASGVAFARLLKNVPREDAECAAGCEKYRAGNLRKTWSDN